MDLEKLKVDVSDWIVRWVSVSNPNLGKIPCPFAKNALLNNKIDWHWVEDANHLKLLLRSIMEQGLSNEVLVAGMDPNMITTSELSEITKQANEKWLMPMDIVALEDHPNDLEIIAGTKMNQGTYALVLIQSKTKLNQASKILHKQGYYDNWTQKQIDDVVTWRL